MELKKLYLQDFRKFRQQTWDLNSGITVFLAPNGLGKTTILEAINLLATGKSFRAGKTEELLRFGQEIARVYGLTNEKLKLGLTLTGGQVANKKTSTKMYTIGQTKKQQKDFIGTLLTACFRPEDLRLIEGASNRRRAYLDGPLELTSSVYLQATKNYQATLIRRNKTLQAIRDGELTITALSYWNQNLLTYGEIIHEWRQTYIDFVNQEVSFLIKFALVYDHSRVTPERLLKYQSAEIAVGHTLIGPHKDDLTINFDFDGTNASLMTYGSRGQHRMAVLWLKLAELAYLEKATGQKPILLLDDILSELDDQAKSLVIDLSAKQQTLVTTTEKNVIELFQKRGATIVNLTIE